MFAQLNHTRALALVLNRQTEMLTEQRHTFFERRLGQQFSGVQIVFGLRKIQGFWIAPRPIITASQPVVSNVSRTS